MVDISAIITTHNEGYLVPFAVKSAQAAIEYTRNKLGLVAELIISLDRPDQITKSIVEEAYVDHANLAYPDVGDLGPSRNFCAKQAKGKYIAFLDADDLWSYNWLADAWLFAERHTNVVCHPQVYTIFSGAHTLYWHIDSDGGLFDPQYLRWNNYWDSLCFIKRTLFLKFPQKEHDFVRQFGYEDWSWNIQTLNAGLTHKSVPETVHFKRRRSVSLLSKLSNVNAVVWPDPVLNKEIERIVQ